MEAGNTAQKTTVAFQPVIDQCEGCDRIVKEGDTAHCATYINPAAKWRLGICNFATHAKPEIKVVKVRINPLKAAKRASSKRR